MFVLKSLAMLHPIHVSFPFNKACLDDAATKPSLLQAGYPIPPVPWKKFTPCQVYHLPTDSSSLEPMFGRGLALVSRIYKNFQQTICTWNGSWIFLQVKIRIVDNFHRSERIDGAMPLPKDGNFLVRGPW